MARVSDFFQAWFKFRALAQLITTLVQKATAGPNSLYLSGEQSCSVSCTCTESSRCFLPPPKKKRRKKDKEIPLPSMPFWLLQLLFIKCTSQCCAFLAVSFLFAPFHVFGFPRRRFILNRVLLFLFFSRDTLFFLNVFFGEVTSKSLIDWLTLVTFL